MPDLNDRLLYRPAEAFELLGVGRAKGYALVKEGTIPVVRLGRSTRIPAAALKRWIEQNMSADALERGNE